MASDDDLSPSRPAGNVSNAYEPKEQARNSKAYGSSSHSREPEIKVLNVKTAETVATKVPAVLRMFYEALF